MTRVHLLRYPRTALNDVVRAAGDRVLPGTETRRGLGEYLTQPIVGTAHGVYNLSILTTAALAGAKLAQAHSTTPARGLDYVAPLTGAVIGLASAEAFLLAERLRSRRQTATTAAYTTAYTTDKD